jgi:uncharacterized protein (DUF305 family)
VVATETLQTLDRATPIPTPLAIRVTSAARRATLGALALAAVVVCQPASAQATAGGARADTSPQASHAVAVVPKSDSARRPLYVEGDVRFMQGMIAHHAQALAMVALIPDRTPRQDMHLLGKRIEISQRDEISLMQHWLEDRHQEVPKVDAQHMVSMPGMEMGTLMPGMLTDEQMAQLAKASGPDFDRLFLEGMIRHHQGALVMVAHLFDTKGAGQEAEAFRFASDVDADQRAEIRRMQAMLDAMPATGTHHP